MSANSDRDLVMIAQGNAALRRGGWNLGMMFDGDVHLLAPEFVDRAEWGVVGGIDREHVTWIPR